MIDSLRNDCTIQMVESLEKDDMVNLVSNIGENDTFQMVKSLENYCIVTTRKKGFYGDSFELLPRFELSQICRL